MGVETRHYILRDEPTGRIRLTPCIIGAARVEIEMRRETATSYAPSPRIAGIKRYWTRLRRAHLNAIGLGPFAPSPDISGDASS